MELTVRPATPADAEAIAQLNRAFDDLRTTPAQIADFIATHPHFERPYVAERSGAVVGMACLRLLPCALDPLPYAELTELKVDPNHQRHGVGRALVRHIEDEARAQGAAELVLITAWRNTRAHAFYHALGYGLYTLTMRRSLRD
jgi:ribosomal protein S18 acetylase RimI-like enzyme